jgi:fatty-acyl-CoA synthase
MLDSTNRHTFSTLHDAVTLQVPGEHPAIIYLATDLEPVIVTRREFGERTTTTAAALSELGVRPRDLVVIAHTQNLESIFAFWGAMWLGAIPSMFPTLTEKLDADVYMHSMAELVRLSNVAAILTTDEFATQVSSVVSCPVFSSSQLQHVLEKRPDHNRQSNFRLVVPDSAIAFLQHSSGTTGLQKGVALSHAAVLNQIAAYSEAIALTESDVIISWLPLYHDMGLIAGFLLPLIQGIPLVLMSPFDWVHHPALLMKAIHEYRGTLCWLPNFAYNHCARRIRRRDSENLSLESMRLFINCSEPVRHDSQQLFLQRFTANGVRPEMLGVSYAMAENTFAVTQTPPGRPARLDYLQAGELETYRRASPADPQDPAAEIRVSCGPPIFGTEVRIVGDDGHMLADRQVGQIALRSPYLLSGYYLRPDLEPFVGGWYMTGDLGYLAEGEVYVIGRSKDLIINAGKNIYPQDIEAVVNEVPGVHAGRAVVFGVPDEREGTELVAVVAEVKTQDETEQQSIRRAIRLAVVHQTSVTVSYIHLVGPKWLLKTSSGKIARGANREKWLKEVRNGQDLPPLSGVR